jgi:hypothetical protein
VSEHEAAYALAVSRGVIAVTVKDIDQLNQRAREAGAFSYLISDADRSKLE